MYLPRRLPPGPAGTSCLTCKRRHKKCDLQKPICERCSKGGYECLGYDHRKSGGNAYDKPSSSDRIKSAETRRSNPRSPRSTTPSLPPLLENEDSPRTDEPFTRSASGSEAASTTGNLRPHFTDGDTANLAPLKAVGAPRGDTAGLPACHDPSAQIYDTFPPTRPKIPATMNVLGSPLTMSAATSQQHLLRSSPLLFVLASQIPRITSSPSDTRVVMQYAKLHFDRIINTMYFRPQKEQVDMFQREFMWRVSTCSFARKSILLDAKITDSVLEGTDTVYCPNFTIWIEDFEQEVHARLAQPLTSHELQERLTNILEMFLLKGVLLDASTTYRLFCRVTPSFLQMVYSDPTLQPTQEYSILVSIAHLLASRRYEPACLMLMDIMGSMIYGVPQLVGYDTDVSPFHLEPHAVEWVNCFPGEFLIILARINICRDQGEMAGDWQIIEHQLVSWRSQPKFEPKGVESWKSIAWVAIQETWRHTLLIYLYLAICGVPTDDPRIQSSLRQLFQLMRVIRRQDPPITNVHFFAQCLVAGICSHTEKRRQLVRERLGCAAETRFWMFRGPEIVPVLDHLWGGVALGGRAITWSDYLNSRRAVLPL